MEKFKNLFSESTDEERQSSEGLSSVVDTTTLSWSTRIKGFVICFCIGALLSAFGSVAVFFSKYSLFGVLYSFGSIISLLSTIFLMGPMNQLKKMFELTRLVATIVVLISIILTLLAGLVWHKGMLCLIFVAFQFLAMTWYSISYIPFARDAVMKCFQTCWS